jgi:hypothetical protein
MAGVGVMALVLGWFGMMQGERGEGACVQSARWPTVHSPLIRRPSASRAFPSTEPSDVWWRASLIPSQLSGVSYACLSEPVAGYKQAYVQETLAFVDALVNNKEVACHPPSPSPSP